MSASLSTAPSAFYASKRGQLRETLAGIVSSSWVLYILFFSPLGVLGAHHAWLGHWKRFLAYLITFGLWGGGWLYDLLHFAELTKEQHDQQHKPVGHAAGSPTLCGACAAWALRVEGKAGRANAKPDSSRTATSLRPTAHPASSSSLPTWSTLVPSVAATQLTHHTALSDAFPLPPPPAPSHTHNKRKSDADESERPISVRVRSAEIEDNVERMGATESRRTEATVRQRAEDTERSSRERQGMQREEELKQGGLHREERRQAEHERAAGQLHDEQGSRHQQLKQAILEPHTSQPASGGAHPAKLGDGVVYLQTITPSKDTTTPLEQHITYSPSPTAGSLPLKPVEPVAVLRPSADGSGSDGNKTTPASSTAPILHTVSHVPAPARSATAEAEDLASGDGGAADGADEQHRDGNSHGNGGRGGHAGNGGGRKRGGKGGRR